MYLINSISQGWIHNLIYHYKSADLLARKLLTKDCKSFWKEVKNISTSKSTITCNINGVSGQGEITKLWENFFQNLLNSSHDVSNKQSVLTALGTCTATEHFSSGDIQATFKILKSGKSAGLDGLYAEHFKYACDQLSVLMSLVINSMILHSYLPNDLMDTIIIPIVKNKKGNVTDMDNYRPIAITSIFSKVLEILVLEKNSAIFNTSANQFGFKSKHSTDMGIFAMQQVVDMYTSLSSPIYICYLDASKAFDRINHWTLFRKLIHKGLPLAIVRLFAFWYTSQQFVIQWGQCLSQKFQVTNGVRQGGILSPMFFNVYVDDLSIALSTMNTGCNLNGVSMNAFLYADDTILVAPSPIALQKLLKCCEQFARENDMLFNVTKTVCMFIRSKKFKQLSMPDMYLNDKCLKVVKSEKYLGVRISNDTHDDDEIISQMRSVYGRGNLIIRNFKHCDESVKLQLFKSFCTNIYCCQLWSSYKKTTYRKINVAYRRIFRYFMKIDNATSVSCAMLNYNVDSLDVLVRKAVFNFRKRLMESDNVIIKTLVNSLFYLDSTLCKRWSTLLF